MNWLIWIGIGTSVGVLIELAKLAIRKPVTVNHAARSFTIGSAYVGKQALVGFSISTDGPGINLHLDPDSARAAAALLLSAADSVDALLKPVAKGGEE